MSYQLNLSGNVVQEYKCDYPNCDKTAVGVIYGKRRFVRLCEKHMEMAEFIKWYLWKLE